MAPQQGWTPVTQPAQSAPQGWTPVAQAAPAPVQAAPIQPPPQKGLSTGVSGSWTEVPSDAQQLGIKNPVTPPKGVAQHAFQSLDTGDVKASQDAFAARAQWEIAHGNPKRAELYSFMAGVTPDLANTTLSPLALGTMGYGGMEAELAENTGKLAQAVRLGGKAIGGAFAATSIPKVVSPSSTISERLGGAAGVVGGVAPFLVHGPMGTPTEAEPEVTPARVEPAATPRAAEVVKTAATVAERRTSQGPIPGGAERRINPPGINPVKDAVVQNAQKVITDPRSDARDVAIAKAQIADAKAHPREEAGNLDLNRIRAEGAKERAPLPRQVATPTPPNPLDKMIANIPDEKLPEFKQTLADRAKELQDNAALTRQLVEKSKRNEANAKTVTEMKATGRPAQPVTTVGPSGEKVYVTNEEGKAQWAKEEGEVGVHARGALALAEGKTPRFSDEDLQSAKFDRAKPAAIPQDAWDKTIGKVKTKFFSDRAKIIKDIDIANDTQHPLDETDIPDRLKDLDATGKMIWSLPRPESGGALKKVPVTEASNVAPLWTMDKATADQLTGRNNRTLSSHDDLLAHADRQDAKAQKHLDLIKHIDQKLAAPPVPKGQQAVESAGGVYKSTWDNGMVEAVLPRHMTEDLPIDPRQKDFVSITVPAEHVDPEYIKNAMQAKRADILQRTQKPEPPRQVPTPNPNEEAAQAQARIEANTQILQKIVDPATINSASDVDAALTNAAEHLKHNQDPRITVPLTATARTRLASSLGMEEKDIFGEKSGQGHSAEEITAAQMILDNSRDATFKAMADARAAGKGTPQMDAAIAALAKHNEIVEGIRDKFSKEAGRALQAVKKITPFDQAVSAWSKMDPAAKVEAARRFTELDPNEPGAMERFARDLKPTMKRSAVFEAWINSLLSGAAALTKFSSDAAMLLTSIPVKFVNGITDAIGATLQGRERQEFAGEALAQAHGFLDGMKTGYEQFLKTFKTETSPNLIDNEFSKFDHAIKGQLGRTIRIPVRTLAAITDGFKVVNYSGRLRAIAWREAVKSGLNPFSDEGNAFINKKLINPTLEMRNEANNFANQQVLQENYDGTGLYNETMRAVLAARSKSSLAKVVVPFAKTPGNFARESAKFSPAGFYGTVKEAVLDRSRLNQASLTLEASKQAAKLHPGEEFYKNKAAEAQQTIKSIQQRAFDRRSNLSKNILGTGAFLFAMDQALKGHVTGAGPQNAKTRQELLTTGWQPYSVKIGNNYISYRRNPQAFVALGTAADIAEAMKENPGRTNLSKRVLSGLHKTVALGTDITFLNSLSSMYRLIEGQESLAQTASYEAIPAGVRNVAHIIDSRVTDPRNAAQQFEAQIPFLSKKVPSKIDVTGQPETLLKKNLGGFSPFTVSQGKENEALAEQMRLQANTPTTPHVTGRRTGGVGTHAPQISITPDEQKQLNTQDEQINNQRINAFIRHPGYVALSDAQKREGIDHIKRQTQLSRIYRLQELRSKSKQ